jgi:hypothetical protein
VDIMYCTDGQTLDVYAKRLIGAIAQTDMSFRYAVEHTELRGLSLADAVRVYDLASKMKGAQR